MPSSAKTSSIISSSFRDPAGFVFCDNGVYKRIITEHGEPDYIRLMSSGLYDDLARDDLLVPHKEEEVHQHSPVRRVIVPEQVRIITYPYEWSFGQLRDAALLTLEIQKRALKHGLSLKDASAFNVQFRGPVPVFIDTLSFEENDGGPWVAYSQFCRHFLAPLLLTSRVSPSFNQYLKTALDGFPLDVASRLLPWTTYLRPSILLHIHLHARSQKKYADAGKRGQATVARKKPAIDPKPGFVDSLMGMVRGLEASRSKTEWAQYYEEASHYAGNAEQAKKQAVSQVLDRVSPSLVYDLGGNTGEYSRLATTRGIDTVCFDIDPVCVHNNYERSRSSGDRHMLPLLMDLSNPTPSLGFGQEERMSLAERPQADLLLALALIHHLRITANAPFSNIAAYLARLGQRLLIEYVPKDDTLVQVLLQNRKDTFFDYREDVFRAEFQKHFDMEETFPVTGSGRILYLFSRRQ